MSDKSVDIVSVDFQDNVKKAFSNFTPAARAFNYCPGTIAVAIYDCAPIGGGRVKRNRYASAKLDLEQAKALRDALTQAIDDSY